MDFNGDVIPVQCGLENIDQFGRSQELPVKGNDHSPAEYAQGVQAFFDIGK
jgi:hypothetical protein